MVDFLEEELNVQVFLAFNGQQALTIIDNIKPDLFILDYHLPDMSGLAIYDRVHALDGLEDVPTLIVSGDPPILEIEQRGLSSLQKPFDLDELLLIVEQLLKSDKILLMR
jgi:DNA-binding response OmpR family regulator